MSHKKIEQRIKLSLQERKEQMRFGTPSNIKDVNYGQRGSQGNNCNRCRWGRNWKSEERRPQFLWCIRLYNPDRLDNQTNPKNQQIGMWTPWDFGCDVFKTKYYR